MCGEKQYEDENVGVQAGSPPHMRGKGHSKSNAFNLRGITPAHAGKSVNLEVNEDETWDHPRTCGEKTKKIP